MQLVINCVALRGDTRRSFIDNSLLLQSWANEESVLRWRKKLEVIEDERKDFFFRKQARFPRVLLVHSKLQSAMQVSTMLCVLCTEIKLSLKK
jgi:hypothetical protein